MQLRFAQDKLISTDKLFHALRDGLVTLIVYKFSHNLLLGIIVALLFAILWEIKDGLVKYEIFQDWLGSKTRAFPRWLSTFVVLHLNLGGDGFSYRDILAGCFGIFIAVLLA